MHWGIDTGGGQSAQGAGEDREHIVQDSILKVRDGSYNMIVEIVFLLEAVDVFVNAGIQVELEER